jgi:hypothetical protein
MCLAVVGLQAPQAMHAQTQSVVPAWDRNLVQNGDFSADGGSLDGWTSNQGFTNFFWTPLFDGTNYYAYNGCAGAACITGDATDQNELSQTIQTIPGLVYKVTFTYDGGAGGVNELKVLFGERTIEDIVNVNAGSNVYTVTVRAFRFDTKLNFLGRQDNSFALLSNVSVRLDLPRIL